MCPQPRWRTRDRMARSARAYWCLVALSGLAVGCAETLPPDAIRVIVADSAGIEVLELVGSVEALPEWLVEDAAIQVVGGSAPPYLGQIGEVALLPDGRLVVEDNHTFLLRVFTEGSSTDAFGGKGDGPSEFRSITSISVRGDSIHAFDRRLDRLVTFDLGGTHRGTISLASGAGRGEWRPRRAWVLGSARIVSERTVDRPTDTALLPRQVPEEVALFQHDREGVVSAGPATFPGGYGMTSDYADLVPPFANRAIVAVNEDLVAYTSGLTYEIVVSDAGLIPRRIVRWPSLEEALLPEEVARIRSRYDSATAETRAQAPEYAAGVRETRFGSAALPPIRPTIGQLIVDDESRIWVSRFMPINLGALEGEAWHVLGKDGRTVARFSLPAGSRLAAVAGGMVAVVRRDSLDVEEIAVLTLRATR